MKKVLLFGSLILLSSCKSDVPKCSDELLIDRLKAMIVENKDRQLLKLGSSFGELYNENNVSVDTAMVRLENEIVEKNLESKEALKVINIITTETNNETKSCSCEATLDNVKPYTIEIFNKILENGQTINYSIKTTDDGEKIIELSPIY